MNASLYRSARRLDHDRIIEDRGAYFKALHRTLAHLSGRIVCGWIALPTCKQCRPTFSSCAPMRSLVQARSALDQAIAGWAGTVTLHWLEQPLSWYGGAYKRIFTQLGWLAVTHFFNHQTQPSRASDHLADAGRHRPWRDGSGLHGRTAADLISTDSDDKLCLRLTLLPKWIWLA